MEKRFIDETRNYIRQCINNIDKNFYDIEKSTLLFTEYLFSYYSLTNNKTEFEAFYTMVCQVIYLDTYKHLSYKRKHLIFSENEELYWKIINEIDSFMDLYLSLSSDPDFFAFMLETSYNYQESNYLVKLIQMRSLDDDENQHLIEIAPIHEIELKQYKTDINMKKIIKYYRLQVKHYNNDGDIDSEEKALNNTVNFIKQLSIVDRDNYITLVKELINTDYIISSLSPNYVSHLDVYNKNNIEDVIQIYLNNTDFLRELLMNILDYNNEKTKGDTSHKGA